MGKKIEHGDLLKGSPINSKYGVEVVMIPPGLTNSASKRSRFQRITFKCR
jgi:hypothetical protein